MDRDILIKNLLGKITDADYTRITESFPVSNRCPTCGDKGAYVLDGKEHTCDCQIQKLLQRSYYYANIPKEYHSLSIGDFFGDDKETLIHTIEDYIKSFEDYAHSGLGLTFVGSYGTGKTLAMTLILKELSKQGKNVFFITFDELVVAFASEWKNGEAKYLYNRLKTTEVLGLDELKTDQRNDQGFLSDALQNLVRHRTSNLLPTLLTTNLHPEKAATHFVKAFSLLSARNKMVVLKGKDVRPDVQENRQALVREHGRRPIS